MWLHEPTAFPTRPTIDIRQGATPPPVGHCSQTRPTGCRHPLRETPMLPSARFLICLSLLLPLTAVAGDGEASPDAERLETLLYQDCGSCHGMTLRGGLGPALPRDRMQALSPEALTHIIRHGIPGTAMPGWQALLSEAEARWIADHLQTDNRLKTLDD